MAGDWLKVEKSTARKIEVIRIAGQLGIHPDHAFGLCFRFWCWCDENLTDGNAPGVTTALLDALLERSGFADALVSVGWLRVRDSSLEVPNFDRHLSQGSKVRALTAKRVAEHKRKGNAKGNAPSVSDALPRVREEEEKNTNTRKRVFVAPTLDEIRECWRLESLCGDAEEFFLHYQANGWTQGSKSKPLADWRAAARHWSKRQPLFEAASRSSSASQRPLGNATVGATVDPRPTSSIPDAAETRRLLSSPQTLAPPRIRSRA